MTDNQKRIDRLIAAGFKVAPLDSPIYKRPLTMIVNISSTSQTKKPRTKLKKEKPGYAD
jgi:hypothetical protein